MTKMAATPIYGKTIEKIFFFQNWKSYDLKLGMQHQGLQLYKIYIIDDPGLTLTYFKARSNLVVYTFELETLLQSHLMGKTCSKGLN